ncbi:MAG: VCBS repeat-containing protein [Ferruginibacter sp.]
MILLFAFGCKNNTATKNQLRFTMLDAAYTNIDFNNHVTESDSINVFTNEYMYNGSGVGIGDFNNDGLQDVFFTGSMVSSKLYINKGNMQFEDITGKAGVQTGRWCTGVSIIDINGDGFMDIYVCASHAADKEKRKNYLFINDGKLHFSDQAAAYGLADTGYATQAAFLDYDKDGDLDVYLLNHRLYSHTANNLQPKDTSGTSPAQDRLYRNEGVPAGSTHPVFQDVSAVTGIKEDGYGLGITVTDINNDGWPDIYVANDYIANDLLWLNNKNGTFSNIISAALRHQSYNSMGVDAADINNDLLPDITTLDMLPETNERKKMMFNATNQEKFDLQLRYGYEPSFVRNMLQLNNGNRMVDNKEQPFYSEIGELAGIFETDWSWSVLMADFDNDGWKDIHITNGLAKDVTNNDYVSFRNGEAHTNNYTFGAGDPGKKLDAPSMGSLRKNIDQYGTVKMDNYLFHNNGNLTFSDVTGQAGLALPSISNGAAYADLDNDGDLDLIVNNMNQQAFICRNEIRQAVTDTTQNFIRVVLQGDKNNSTGIGSRVIVFNGDSKQVLEQSPVRGFCSSVDQRLLFGIGRSSGIDSLQIEWPGNKVQSIKNIKANQQLLVKQADATVIMMASHTLPVTVFSDITVSAGIDFKHAESQHFDFGYHQPLLQKYSQLGPCIAVGDVNGDGLEDFFAGGAANQPGEIFIQQPNGGFIASGINKENKPAEDAGALFFDADGDEDLDLVVTGGSFEFTLPQYNQPRLYLNNGKGNFKEDATALPSITDITKAVAVADYDDDGDLDLFIGGRLSPQKYPQSPRSYLLQNNNGKFTDITKQVCPSLEFAGMVDAALFVDLDNDHMPDLVTGGEWTPLRFFKNKNSQLLEITGGTGLAGTSGFWRSLQQADIDTDGDMDIVAGNLGLNNRFHIAAGTPMKLYAKDIDKNGFTEIIPAAYTKDNSGAYTLFPLPDRNQLSEQLPSVKKQYLLHADYAKRTMEQIKKDYGADSWSELTCETSASVWIENKGNGQFKLHQLPLEAQFAPVNSIVADDINNDGHIDLVIAGNEYQASASIGRYDASYGLLMTGDGKGNFTPVSPARSGLVLDGDIKGMKLLTVKHKGKMLLASPNDSKLKIFQLNAALKKGA